jgi:hypothetical protein
MNISHFILIAVLFPSLAVAQPSIVFVDEKIDFGIVEQGKLLEGTFKFSNQGPDELIITDVNTS